jgi:hypothetical protein
MALERRDEKPRKKYLDRAAQMLKLAKEARSEDARSSYLNLAASWDALARQGGNNSQNG